MGGADLVSEYAVPAPDRRLLQVQTGADNKHTLLILTVKWAFSCDRSGIDVEDWI